MLACNSADPTAFRIDVDGIPDVGADVARTGSAAGRYRENACATLLPTGQVLVTGGWPEGSGADDPTRRPVEPELYTPGIYWDAGDFSNSAAEEWDDDRGAGAEPPRLPLHRPAAARRPRLARRFDDRAPNG